MQRKILSEAVKLNKARRRRKRWYRMVGAMAAVVVFVTTYALILPAITMEKDTICGLEEHEHTRTCYYEPVWDIGQVYCCVFELHEHNDTCFGMEGEILCGYADFVVHEHDDSCYDANNNLMCELEEYEEHIHDDACYEFNTTYECGLEEGADCHLHGDECYDEPVLSCLLEETEDHTHDDDCFAQAGSTCPLEEFEGHTHDDNCYGEPKLICVLEETDGHSHDDACYSEPVLSCLLEENEGHTHGDDCYGEPSLSCLLEEFEDHTHTGECYDEPVLECLLEEMEGHSHDDDCFEEPVLECTLDEAEGHSHGSGCYGEPPLECTLEESEGHIHSEACSGEKELICQQKENDGHIHDENCYEEPLLSCILEESEGHIHDESCGGVTKQKLICQRKEIVLHVHSDDCYDEQDELICGMLEVLEHQHGEECFAQHEHTDDCYRIIATYQCLLQESDGHVHDDTCAVETEETLICSFHVHEDDCYDESGSQICDQPILICGMEEHTHEESCYPEVDDGNVDVIFEIPEEYEGYISSEAIFPMTLTIPAETSLLEYGEMPILAVVNPNLEFPEYLEVYHWVTEDGFVVDEAEPLTEDTILTLRLYSSDDLDAARLVTATFVCEGEVLLERRVNTGTVVSDLIDTEMEERLEKKQTKRLHFDGWTYLDEVGVETELEYGLTTIFEDTVYTAVFRQYVPFVFHDIDPNGEEYEDSPLELLLPVESQLTKQGEQITLSDGTPISSCIWYTEDGALYDPNEPIFDGIELYTYSYSLQLNLTTLEPAPMLMTLSLDAEASSADPEPQPNAALDVEEELEGEGVTIVKRSGDELTESDFIVDGTNYGNYQWIDESGNEVDTDDLVGTTLTSNYALSRAATVDYTITYNINVTQNGIFGTSPTVGGETSLSDIFNTGEGTYTIRIPNPASYMVENGNKKTLYQFAGWKISRNSNIIDAGETVDADWFTSNVNRRTTTVTLTAQWTSLAVTETVHFFVNLNCQIVDMDGNTGIPDSGDFTPSVFSTTMSVSGASMLNYWQGAINKDSWSTQYVMARADNANDSEAIDAELRRLINGHDSTYDTYNGVSVWKSGYTGTKVFQVEDFPSDEHVLSVVREMVEDGTVIRMNGVPLTAEELTAENFTVRWNVCKYDTGDGWHIDGILVGKQGYLTVKKTFLGDDAAVQEVKDGGFTITVENTTNASASDVILTLNDAKAETGGNRVGYSDYDSDSDTYTWTLPLEQNNQYSIIENDYISTDAAVQTSASYTISNSPDAFTGWKVYPEDGITEITAHAYANDVYVSGYQTVALRNSYVKADTLTINKIDMDTGNGLANISYRLTDVDGNDLTLYKKPDVSYYSMKEEDQTNGFELCDDSVITTGSNGTIFLKLDNGTFILEEAFPTGYGGYSKINVTVGADSNGNVIFENVTSTDSTIQVDGTLVDNDTATLTIRNVSYSTSVTAQKIWASAPDVQEVTVALYRNGVSMGSEYQKVLNSSNNWTYTWNDLPLYADGMAADYTLREIKIGSVNYDPSADTDGYSGYIVSYDNLIYFKNDEKVSGPVWVDDNGVTQYADNARLVVRNEVYRGQLVFLKVDGNGTPLAGATFRLYADSEQTQVLAEATSDEYGRVIFENLMPDTYYVMKESDTPEGYLGADALYKVRLSSQGSTFVEDTSTGEALTAIVNYVDEVEVQLFKVSEFESPLAGAVFQLERQENGVWTAVGTYESGSDGKLQFGALGAGTYRLKELQAPNGYVPLDVPIEFVIQNAELILTDQSDLFGSSRDYNTGLYTIKVINETGYELPKTGGLTARLYTYGGSLFILSAAVLLGYQFKRRREGDSS